MSHDDSRIDELIDHEKWAEARRVIEAELQKRPDHHWLLDRLSLTYYEEQNYQTAFTVIVRAFQKLPTCPIVLWDYAGTLDALGQSRLAISVYYLIVNKSLHELAFGECGEGLDWAKALQADCVFRIGVCHRNLGEGMKAAKYYRDYLLMRRNGSGGIYHPDEVEKELATLQPLNVECHYPAAPILQTATATTAEFHGPSLPFYSTPSQPMTSGAVTVTPMFEITEAN